MEIRNYIERVFETNGIIVHDYKQHYNASTLNLYISYFVTSDFLFDSSQNLNKLVLKKADGNLRNIQQKKTQKNSFSCEVSSSRITSGLPLNSRKLYNIKQYLTRSLYSQAFYSFFENVRETRKNKYLQVAQSSENSNVEGFFTKTFAVLNSFLNTHLNIVVNFSCVNKNVHFYKLTQKKTFISFQKFKNTPFFKEGIELLFNVAYNRNSANLLAKFIAFQLKKVKRHKFFLSFLKQILSVLLASSLAKIKGVKIIVKGRLNGVPRAKHKIIIIGDVPVQTISAKLDYSQTTAHNSNGSYGIKVWVVEK